MSFSRWLEKQTAVPTDNEYDPALKRNELVRHGNTWRKLKCIWLSEISQFEKAAYHVKVSVTWWYLTLCDTMDPTRLLCPWNFPGKNTGVGCHSLLQWIFPTQGLNLGLLHCRQILYHLSQQGIWLQLYDIMEKEKLWRQWKDQWLLQGDKMNRWYTEFLEL